MDAQPTFDDVAKPTLAAPPQQATSSLRVGTSVRWSTLRAVAPFAVFLAAGAFAFRYPLFEGYRWIGNSDRWNQYLLFAQFHADSLNSGTFRAWSNNLIEGFDTLAQPFSFFSPLFLIPPLFHTSDVVAVFAYVDFAIFVLTLAISYWVIQRLTHDRLASMTGAFIYTCSTCSLLKLSQNDTTYLSIIVAPIMFYLVHSATREHRLRTIVLLAAIVAYCIYVGFLQEFSYVVLFLGLYALWRSVKGNHESLIALAAGMTAGLVIGVPRLVAQYQTLSDTPRISTGVVFDGDLFTLLRFFSRDIYGRSYAESLTGSSVNLYEGDLLFVAAFASLLLVAILIDRGRHARTPWNSLRRTDIGFLLAYIVFVFATMHVQLVYRAVSLLYANAPFQHSRIGVSALLPIACLSALYLRRRHQRQLNLASWLTIAVALALVVSATTFDYESWRDPILNALGQPSAPFIACDACMKLKQTGQFLAVDVIRLVVLAVLFVLLATSWRWLRWFSADGVRTALALAITFQAVWGANAWLTGPDTTEYATPFDGNNMVLAPPGDFAHPTADEMQQLQSRLDNREYRSITVCPLDVIVVDCSNPMGILWNLRLLDGYLSGVPRRLGELPWQPNEVSSHQIRFRQATDVPWRLMSLLNVKNAIVVTPDLYTNAGSHLPDGLQIVENPSPYVYPRAYFAHTVESVSEAEDVAVTHDFFAECRQCDNLLEAPKPVDEVEGPVTGDFDATGDVAVLDGADRIDLTFPASAHPRFLILNELYARGWSASADGQELAIYPTNVVMRGVLVPTGATHVTFAYHSFLQFAGWYTLGLLGFATLAYLLISRFSRHRPPLPLGEVARSAGEG